jgi:hypothetical protein
MPEKEQLLLSLINAIQLKAFGRISDPPEDAGQHCEVILSDRSVAERIGQPRCYRNGDDEAQSPYKAFWLTSS